MREHEQLWGDVREQLDPLDAIFDGSKNAAKYRSWFSETMDRNELELALHAVCDFLFACPAVTLSAADLDRIRLAHELMSLEDDCIHKLTRRAESL